MEGTLRKLKDSGGDYVLPVTSASGVFLADGTTTVEGKLARATFPTIAADFFSTSAVLPWQNTAISSGTVAADIANMLHPGFVVLSSSASQNSGYRYILATTAITLVGGENTTIVFKTAPTLTGVTRRLGFHNTFNSSEASDGAFAFIADGVLKGRAINSSSASDTDTTYTLAADTWYRLVISLNADATAVVFTLYADNSTTVLWTAKLSANIPKNRQTGHGDVCTYGGTSAIVIGSLDYMDAFLPSARIVV